MGKIENAIEKLNKDIQKHPQDQYRALVGEHLIDCITTEEIADQETAVFFIRKKEEPDKPYFTLELQNKKVIQCRTEGQRSYGTELEVFMFVDQWMKRVVNKGGKKKEDNAA